MDHHIIEYAMGIPDAIKVKNGESKYLLKKILAKYIPTHLLDRPKQGFAIPLNDWLKDFILQDAEKIVNDSKFIQDFDFKKKEVKAIFDNFLNGHMQQSRLVWFLFILFNWHKKWMQ